MWSSDDHLRYLMEWQMLTLSAGTDTKEEYKRKGRGGGREEEEEEEEVVVVVVVVVVGAPR